MAEFFGVCLWTFSIAYWTFGLSYLAFQLGLLRGGGLTSTMPYGHAHIVTVANQFQESLSQIGELNRLVVPPLIALVVFSVYVSRQWRVEKKQVQLAGWLGWIPGAFLLLFTQGASYSLLVPIWAIMFVPGKLRADASQLQQLVALGAFSGMSCVWYFI